MFEGVYHHMSVKKTCVQSLKMSLCVKTPVCKSVCVQELLCIKASVCKNFCVKASVCKGVCVSKVPCDNVSVCKLLSSSHISVGPLTSLCTCICICTSCTVTYSLTFSIFDHPVSFMQLLPCIFFKSSLCRSVSVQMCTCASLVFISTSWHLASVIFLTISCYIFNCYDCFPTRSIQYFSQYFSHTSYVLTTLSLYYILFFTVRT